MGWKNPAPVAGQNYDSFLTILQKIGHRRFQRAKYNWQPVHQAGFLMIFRKLIFAQKPALFAMPKYVVVNVLYYC
ncbi:MAG: hypothetical protein D6768_19360 [Chloroflexi bacterium]|nr:MAG: hypothetical protein D6768_19360 [Chloroflexota bacterium]